MQKKEILAKLVKFYMEEQSLQEQIKEVKSEAKEQGLNPAVLAQVAKAVVSGKIDELLEKTEATIETIQEHRS